MEIAVRKAGKVTVLDLVGKVTLAGGNQILREKAAELIESGEHFILFNLEGVSYMDSTGLSELLSCFKNAEAKGGTVKLLNPAGKIFDLLRVTKLDDVFEIYHDEQEAVAAF